MNNNLLGDQEDYVLQKSQAWVKAFIQEQLWLWKGKKNQASQKYEDTVCGVESIN